MKSRSRKYFSNKKWITKGYERIVQPMEIFIYPSVIIGPLPNYRNLLLFPVEFDMDAKPITVDNFCDWANKNWPECGTYAPGSCGNIVFKKSEEYLRREREGLLYTELLGEEEAK